MLLICNVRSTSLLSLLQEMQYFCGATKQTVLWIHRRSLGNFFMQSLQKKTAFKIKVPPYDQGRTGGKKWPGSYCQTGPLNTRRVAHSMHCTYRPVSGLLGKIPIHLTLFWMITKKLHHICFFLITFGSTNLPGWTHGIKWYWLL